MRHNFNTATSNPESRRREAMDTLYRAGMGHFTTDNTAFVMVDVQNRYSSDITPRLGYRLKSLLPAFRALGVPVYAVYVTWSDPACIKDIGFNNYKPQKGDILVSKKTNSAFGMKIDLTENGTTTRDVWLKDVMKSRGIKNIITCGGYFSACLLDTVLDATKNFKVCVLEDLSTDFCYGLPGANEKKQMEKKGAIIANAVPVLRFMQSDDQKVNPSSRQSRESHLQQALRFFRHGLSHPR